MTTDQLWAETFKPFAGLIPWTWPAVVLGALLLIGAFALAFRLGRRRFGRRNFAGIEQFNSYGHAVLTDLGEGALRLLCGLILLASFAAFGLAYLGFMAQRYPALRP